MNSENNKMAVMPMRKLLYAMTVPLMMSLLVQPLYNIVDSIFAARLSEKALTATSLVYTVQFLMIAVSVGTAVGTSLICTIAGLLFSHQIASLMTDDPELTGLCQQYLSVNMVWCWEMFVLTYGQRLLQAVGDSVYSMFLLIIGAVANIILDPIMIFGLPGCPTMGIRGTAIATVIGQMLGTVSALLFNRFRNPLIHVRVRGYRFVKEDVISICRVGLPTIIMQAIGSVMTFSVNAILMNVSDTEAAFSVFSF